MQENKMVETVFRFVTVRNPKKVSYSIEQPVGISVELSSQFQHQLSKVPPMKALLRLEMNTY
jgi:hypothetical protein